MTIVSYMIDERKEINKCKHYCSDIVSRIRFVASELQMPNEVLKRAIRLLQSTCVIVTMTTPDHAAGACLAMAVYSLGLREEYRIYTIAKKLGVSSTAITSRMFKVMASRGIRCQYANRELQSVIANCYPDLIRRM